MKFMKICVSATMLIVLSTLCFAQTKEPLYPYLTEDPPTIDGILEDSVWQKAPMETGFQTYYPDYGSPMSEDTRVWYAYDRKNIYFAFMCFDSEPDKIKTSVTARDKIRSDDWICINLDTFNDQQGLYAFYVNPQGIQMDSRAIGDEEDTSADFVWYSRGRITDKGYAIEMKIPFKSIRYSSQEPVTMGVIFERYISRRSEAGTLPALDPKWGQNFNTQTRPLIYTGIEHYRLFELLPAFTYTRNSNIDQGKLITGSPDTEFSLTGKLGITSHLVLDGTLNPDFSQVEADAGQVDFNRRYALFYPEKRPFFLEGREHLLFGGHTAGDPLEAIVHTRLIVNPSVGIKMTGKIGNNNTLATIYAQDEVPAATGEKEQPQFTILRYKRALTRDSYLGCIYTGRELRASYNRVAGTDGHLRLNRSSFIGYHAFASQTQNESGNRNNGHALGFNYYYHTRDWLLNFRLHDLSKDFHTETGFVTRTGISRFRAGIIRRLFVNSGFIKRIDPLLNNQFIKDRITDMWEHSNSFHLTFILPRMSIVRFGYVYSDEIFLSEKFSTSNVQFISQTQFTKQLFLSLILVYGKKIRYIEAPYQCKGSSVSGIITYQPSDKFSSSFSLMYSDLYKNSDDSRVFDYTIIRSHNTYQINRYFFFRFIAEYNSFYEQLTTDILASFTYIPGTVIHIGYGSRYDRLEWKDEQYLESDRFLETRQSLFFKASYLWRL